MEEEAVWGLDWDSDETVVEGSVTESELEDDELPLKRLFFAQDSSFISDPSFHSDLRRIYGEAASPEIHLVYKLKEYLQEQMNKHMIKPLSEGENETQLSQALTQDEIDNPLFSEEIPQDDLVLDSEWQNEHNYSAGFDTEDFGFLQRPEKGKEGQSSLGQETLAHQNDVCSIGLRKKEDLNTMETTMTMETSSVLRRSARLKAVRARGTPKDIDEVYKMPKEILQKTHSGLPVEYFRTQDPPFQNNSDEKSIEQSKEQVLSPYSSDEQLRKGRKTTKNRKNHRNISKVSSINRRDIYGESLLHKAAQADDSALVKKYIKLGGNVNLPDYAVLGAEQKEAQRSSRSPAVC